jgi:glycosyltransferase involved in cell wall biosynthesis
MNPFFSIIVPAYNQENCIRHAITSVLNQKFQDFELILVNDGSTDNTANILEEYAMANKKIVVVTHLKNESRHIARLDGCAAANGQYVVFMDGDDYFSGNALDILYEEIQKCHGYDFYEFGYLKQPACEKVFPLYHGNDRFSDYFQKEEKLVHTVWNKAYKSETVKKAFANMEKIYLNNTEDLYESIVITYYAKKTLIVKQIIINYLIGTGISTVYKNYEQTLVFLDSTKKSINCINNFLKKNSQNINLDNLMYQTMQYAIKTYIDQQENTEDTKRLFLKLPDFFNKNIISEYLYDKEIELKSIKSSFFYRLSRKLSKLIHK